MRVRGYLAGKLSFSFDQIEFQAVFCRFFIVVWRGRNKEVKRPSIYRFFMSFGVLLRNIW